MPNGSTVIDFAYKVSKDLGNHILSSIINGKEMPVITKLKNGDIIKIITTTNEIIPNSNWLEIVKTAKAKNEILIQLEKVKEKIIKSIIKLDIIAKDKEGLVLQITENIKNMKINILSLNTSFLEKELVKIEIVIEINTIEILEQIIKTISSVEEIKEVIYSVNKKVENYI